METAFAWFRPEHLGLNYMPDIIEQHVNTLREHTGYEIELVEADGLKNIVIKSYPLPRCYSKTASDLLIRLDSAYPNSKPDMFWLEENVVLTGGGIPKNAEEITAALGRRWRRFSWHFNAWNPGTGDLMLFLEFVDTRLGKCE